MPRLSSRPTPRGPARHELPALDDAALAAARAADRLLAEARERGVQRWARFLEPIPGLLRDGEVADLAPTARRARAAFGPRDSIRDALPAEATEPFLESIDRLLKELARRSTGGEG